MQGICSRARKGATNNDLVKAFEQAMAYMKKEDYQAADRPKNQFQQKNIAFKELVCISCQSSCLTVFSGDG